MFGLPANADRLQYGDLERSTTGRVRLGRHVARPFRLSFLDFNPSAGYRYTRYGASYGLDEEDQNAIVGPALNR